MPIPKITDRSNDFLKTIYETVFLGEGIRYRQQARTPKLLLERVLVGSVVVPMATHAVFEVF